MHLGTDMNRSDFEVKRRQLQIAARWITIYSDTMYIWINLKGRQVCFKCRLWREIR